MPDIDDRRKNIFGCGGMQILDISKREGSRRGRDGHTWDTSGDDVLPWIEQYTEGDFYLSEYSVGFADPHDVLMFKLAFKR